ncbi:AlpA family transcriptional regulator [Maricaulis sp.]|uniref:helix-turn-helix transcriptional regulator n=1 Tax=Maricaulis sp. TaxID=1486257 RepID=UPI001B09D8E6|nr:helix-turn-helix domain-containing protein [Maricaulis sp.]MBO6763456.1 helix-turn-helix domain-containing protein [Maricaulis sp.]
MHDSRYLDADKAAAYLGVSQGYLNKLRTTGGGPVFVKVGRRVVYDVADLDQWFADRKRASTSV